MWTTSGELGTLAVTTNRSKLLITDNFAPSLPIIVALMMDAIHSCETSVLITAIRHNIPESDITLRNDDIHKLCSLPVGNIQTAAKV
jgi:hypothetical protein